jgi:hypothetical protein
MKAEHRKELQTNTLAANMGRLVQRIKTKPQRRTILWVILGLVVVIVLLSWWVIHNNRKHRDAVHWMEALNPDLKTLQGDLMQMPKSKPALSARFQLAWVLLWEEGIRKLPESFQSLESIRKAQQMYADLAEDCKGVPDLAAEAHYNVAVAQDSLAVIGGEKGLKEAETLYKEVVDNYPDTARAKDARERLKVLQNEHSRQQILELYRTLGFMAQIGRFGGGKMPPGHPSVP